ncbi:MAG: acyltransferase [Cyanobacteria bacterium SIG29]|nr:acyltransferase [Cyanobacteria bacterium SIG29]
MQESKPLANFNETARNINIDIIKVLTLFFVVSAHFLWNNNFYYTPITCPRMYVMAIMRTFCMMSIGLFILSSGYLMHQKEFCKSHYVKIKRVLLPYIIISSITFVAKLFLSKYGIFETVTLNNFLSDLIDFRIIEHAWYVDLYIGLFLLIPFLNKMLSNKLQDTVLLIILLFLTALPSLLTSPILILSEWTHLWVITYYLIGAYIAKHDLKISQKLSTILYFSFLAIFAIMNLFFTYGKAWEVPGQSDSFGGYQCTITGVLFFLMILKTDFSNLSDKVKLLISNIAKLSLGIFLSTFIFEKIFYYYLNMYITDTTAKLEWYFVIVPTVFVCSILMAKFVDVIYKYIDKKFLSFNNH